MRGAATTIRRVARAISRSATSRRAVTSKWGMRRRAAATIESVDSSTVAVPRPSSSNASSWLKPPAVTVAEPWRFAAGAPSAKSASSATRGAGSPGAHDAGALTRTCTGSSGRCWTVNGIASRIGSGGSAPVVLAWASSTWTRTGPGGVAIGSAELDRDRRGDRLLDHDLVGLPRPKDDADDARREARRIPASGAGAASSGRCPTRGTPAAATRGPRGASARAAAPRSPPGTRSARSRGLRRRGPARRSRAPSVGCPASSKRGAGRARA